MDEFCNLRILLTEGFDHSRSGQVVDSLCGDCFFRTVSFAGEIPKPRTELDGEEYEKRQKYACKECHLPIESVHYSECHDDGRAVNKQHRQTVYEKFPYSFGVT